MEKYCPICEKVHEVSMIERNNECIVKGEVIAYSEMLYHCDNCDLYFSDGEITDNNLLKARDEYRRQHNLLTSYEIKGIRDKYRLSQSDLALILGWGEITITRYETKEIQNENYDLILREINDNPYKLYDYYLLNKSSFDNKKQEKIIQKIINVAPSQDYVDELLETTLIKNHISISSETRGNQVIRFNKIIAIIQHMLLHKIKLYKTKLAKLLWYIDSLFYIKTKKSMTGLAYFHMPYGACPLGLNLILDSKNIVIEEKELDDSTQYLITEAISDYELSSDEKEVIDFIMNYFKNFSTKQIVDYMHKEKAYLETKDKEFISYKYASDIKFK